MQYRIRNPLSMTIFEAKPFRKHGTAWKGKEKKTGIPVSRIGIINILFIIWVNSYHLRISNPSGYLTCFSQQENPACRKKWFLVLHFCGSACISLHVPAARQGRHPRSWSGSSVRLERQPVTLEVVGSSPVRFATLFRKNSRLRAAFWLLIYWYKTILLINNSALPLFCAKANKQHHADWIYPPHRNKIKRANLLN